MDRDAYGVIATYLIDKLNELNGIKSWEDFKKLERENINTTIGNIIGELKKPPAVSYEEDSLYEMAEPPMFIDSMSQDDYRNALYKYLMLFKEPALMLEQLNKIQQAVPFVLVYGGKDPSPPIGFNSKILYGLGDLFRFLHIVKKNAPIMSEVKIGDVKYNPFYAPIKYPIPMVDFSFNEVLGALGTKFNVQQALPSIESVLKITSSMNEKKYYATIVENYKSIMKKLLEIAEGLIDPTFLSKMIPGQERPVEKWEQDNFNMLTAQFLQRHTLQELLEKKERKVASVIPHDLRKIAKKYANTYYR